MIKSDYFIINKTDLAEFVGASLDQMAEDTKTFRGNRPFTFTNLKPTRVQIMSLNGLNAMHYLKDQLNGTTSIRFKTFLDWTIESHCFNNGERSVARNIFSKKR